MSLVSRKVSTATQASVQVQVSPPSEAGNSSPKENSEEAPSIDLQNFQNLFDFQYSYDLTKFSGSTKVSSQFGNSYLVPYGSRIIRVKNNSKWASAKSSNKNWFTAYIGTSPAMIINLLKANYQAVVRKQLLYTLDPNGALTLTRDSVTHDKKVHQMVLQVLVDPIKCIINHRDTASAHLITDLSSIQPYAVCLYPVVKPSHSSDRLAHRRSISPRMH